MNRLTPFISRVLLFLTLFIVESGIAGSWLISTQKLLYPFGFWVYGSAGKVLLFSILVLALLLREQVQKIKLPSWRTYQTIGICASLSLLVPFFGASMNLLIAPTLVSMIIAHASLILMIFIAFLSCFPISFLKGFIHSYQKQIGIAVGIGIGFWVAMERLFSFWPYLSHMVLNSVVFLLSFTHHDVTIVPPLTIRFISFSITVGQYCSGIESLLLLSVLYIVMGCLDYKKLDLLRYSALYVVLIVGMLVVNIVRVYSIIQAGFWISPQVAAKFFHTYLGMLLFLSYFLLMISTLYPLTMKAHNTKRKDTV